MLDHLPLVDDCGAHGCRLHRPNDPQGGGQHPVVLEVRLDETPEQLGVVARNHVEPLIHDQRGDTEVSECRACLLVRLQGRNEDVKQRLEHWFGRPVSAERVADAQPERLDERLLVRYAGHEAAAERFP